MEMAIEVRTLAGESTVVCISPERRVADLKVLLSSLFPPAMASSTFYLFFKGSRLKLDSRIDSHQIGDGEFMVLVPYTKKIQKVPSQIDTVEQDSDPPLKNSTAESIWLDIMDDLSNVNSSLQRNGEGEGLLMEEKHKRRRKVSDGFHTILDILRSDDAEDVFENKASIKISQFVESINCLSDPDTGMCLLHFYFKEGFTGGDHCVCPLWMKKLIKTFTLVNVLYAFFHLQRKWMTMGFLKDALEQSNIFGLDELCTSFVKNLSVLCPKVVIILDNEESIASPQGSAIIIHALSTVSSNQPMLAKEQRARRVPTSSIVSAVEKRMANFIMELQILLKRFMENKYSKTVMPSVPSMEDILALKSSYSFQECSNFKKAKSGTSRSKCCCTNHLRPTEMIDHLRKGMGVFGQVVHIEEIKAKLAVHVDVPDRLADVSKAALKRIGISKLYSHQSEALHSSLSGNNVVVATSTSSGKSLCYNIPVIESLSKDIDACALYIFPTKALAQDQMRALTKMTSGLKFDFNIGIYDGDTAQTHRTWIRDNSRVVITNPDMLHLSILPYHVKYQRILSNLRIIVIDEAHIYKGAFGCHAALILRRLRRICFHAYGSNPLFIFCTATSANPCEHAMVSRELNHLRSKKQYVVVKSSVEADFKIYGSW